MTPTLSKTDNIFQDGNIIWKVVQVMLFLQDHLQILMPLMINLSFRYLKFSGSVCVFVVSVSVV